MPAWYLVGTLIQARNAGGSISDAVEANHLLEARRSAAQFTWQLISPQTWLAMAAQMELWQTSRLCCQLATIIHTYVDRVSDDEIAL